MIVAHINLNKSMRIDEHAGEGWFAFVVATALLTNTMLVLVALAAALALAAASMVPPKHLAKMYLVSLPFILAASVSVFLFGGWIRGIGMWARTSACVLSLLVLASGTEAFALFYGLRRLRVPSIITTLLMLTQRYIIVLSDELSRMTTARRARGFRGGRNLFDRYGFKIIAFTAGMVLVRSMRRADDIYEGLKGKGFTKDMKPWRSTRFAAAEASFVAVLLFTSCTLLLVQSGVIT
jgi:cobalt/nickel transport system permease protein